MWPENFFPSSYWTRSYWPKGDLQDGQAYVLDKYSPDYVYHPNGSTQVYDVDPDI